MHVMARGAFHNALIIPVSFLSRCESTEEGGNAKRSRHDDLFDPENLARHLANYVMNQIPSLSIDHMASGDFIDSGIWSEPFNVYSCLFSRASRILFLVTQRDVRAFEKFVSHRLQPLLERAKVADSDWSSRFLILAMGDFQLLTDPICEVVRFREVGWFRDSMALFLLGKKIQDFWTPEATDVVCTPDHLTVSVNLLERETFQSTLSVTSHLEDSESLGDEATTPDTLEQESIRLIRRITKMQVDLKSSRELEVREMLIQTPSNHRFEDIPRPFLKPIRYYSTHSELGFPGTSSDMEDESAASYFPRSDTDSESEMRWSPPDNVSIIGETDVVSDSTIKENPSPLSTANVRSAENLDQSASAAKVEGTSFSTNVQRIDIPSPFLEERVMERQLEAIPERSCEEDSSIVYTESLTAEGDDKIEPVISKAEIIAATTASSSDTRIRPLRQSRSPHPDLHNHEKSHLQIQDLPESESTQKAGGKNDHPKEKICPRAHDLTPDCPSMSSLQQTPATLEDKSPVSTHDEVEDTNISTPVSSKFLSDSPTKPFHISKQVESAEEPKASEDLEAAEREISLKDNEKYEGNEFIDQIVLDENKIPQDSVYGVDQKPPNCKPAKNSKMGGMPQTKRLPNKQSMPVISNSDNISHSPSIFGSSTTSLRKYSAINSSAKEQVSMVMTDLDNDPNDVVSSGMFEGGFSDVSGSVASILAIDDHTEMKSEGGIEDYATALGIVSTRSAEFERPEADQLATTELLDLTKSGTKAEVDGIHCQNDKLLMLTATRTEEVANFSQSTSEKGKDELITNNHRKSFEDCTEISSRGVKQEEAFKGADDSCKNREKESSYGNRAVDECQKESSGMTTCTESPIPSPRAHYLVDDSSLYEGNRASKSEDRKQTSDTKFKDPHLKNVSGKLNTKDQTGLGSTADALGALAYPGEGQSNSFAYMEEESSDTAHSVGKVVEVKEENMSPFQKMDEETTDKARGPTTSIGASKIESETEASFIEKQKHSGDTLGCFRKEYNFFEVGAEEKPDSIASDQKYPNDSLEQDLDKLTSLNVSKTLERESKGNGISTPGEIENGSKENDERRESLKGISEETNLLLKASLDQVASESCNTKSLEGLNTVSSEEIQGSLSRRDESETNLHLETSDMSSKCKTKQDGKTLDAQDYSDTEETQDISKIVDKRKPVGSIGKCSKVEIIEDSYVKTASGLRQHFHLSKQSSRMHGEEGSCEILMSESDINAKQLEVDELSDSFTRRELDEENSAQPAQLQEQVNNIAPSEVVEKSLSDKYYRSDFCKEDLHRDNQSVVMSLNTDNSQKESISLQKEDRQSGSDFNKFMPFAKDNTLGAIDPGEAKHSDGETDAWSSTKPLKGSSPKSPKRVTFLANIGAQNKLVEQATSFAPRNLTSFRQQARFSSGDGSYRNKVDPSIPVYPLVSEVRPTVAVREYVFQETTEIMNTTEWQSANHMRGVDMDLHPVDHQIYKTREFTECNTFREEENRSTMTEIREIRPPEKPTLSWLKEEKEEMKEHTMAEKLIYNDEAESTVHKAPKIPPKCPSPLSGSDCDPEVTSPTMARPRYLILKTKTEPSSTVPKIYQRTRLPSETEPVNLERKISLQKGEQSFSSPHFYPSTAFESVEVNAPMKRLLNSQPDSTKVKRLSSISIEEEPSRGKIEVSDRASDAHSWIDNARTLTTQREVNSVEVQLLHETGEYQQNLSTQMHPPGNQRDVESHGPYYRQIKELSVNRDSSSTYWCDKSAGSPTPLRCSIGSDLSTSSDASVDLGKIIDGTPAGRWSDDTVEALGKVQKALQRASKIISSSSKIIKSQVENLKSQRR